MSIFIESLVCSFSAGKAITEDQIINVLALISRVFVRIWYLSMMRCPFVHTLELEYLEDKWVNLNQIVIQMCTLFFLVFCSKI